MQKGRLVDSEQGEKKGNPGYQVLEVFVGESKEALFTSVERWIRMITEEKLGDIYCRKD